MKKYALALITALGLYYVYVVSLVLRPVVSDEYRAYYIDKSTNIGIRTSRNLHLDSLEPGQKETHTSPRLVFDNWWNPEESHRWSKENSRIVFFLSDENLPRVSGKITVEYVIPVPEAVARISLNGEVVGNFLLDKNGLLSVLVDPRMLHNKNTLAIRYMKPKRASWTDERVIGFGIRSIVIE